MHRSRVPSIAPGTLFVAQSWADCITNMPGFTTGTGGNYHAATHCRLGGQYCSLTKISRIAKKAAGREPVGPHFRVSVNEAGAGRLFQCRSQRAIFLAVGAGQGGDPAEVILRLIAVALFDMPQPVILPGLDVVRVGLQRALVPNLRDLVVAKLAMGVADQIGDGGAVVMTESLQLLDGGGIVIAVIDRGVGRAITPGECR